MEEPTAIRHDESYSIFVDFASGVVGGCSGIIVGQPFDTVRGLQSAVAAPVGDSSWLIASRTDQGPTTDAQCFLQGPNRLCSTDSE